jgi:hypothetical protein
VNFPDAATGRGNPVIPAGRVAMKKINIMILSGVLGLALSGWTACDDEDDDGWSGGGDTDEVMPTCDACHGLPPSTGEHARHVNGMGIHCANCHDATVAEDGTIRSGAPHDDGGADVVLRDGGTYNAGSCSPACHGVENW